MRYANREFRNETVELDGNRFENCTFMHCKLLYFAYERVYFVGCIFTNCDWAFDGPAENMLHFLKDQYHGQGPRGATIADLIFEGIKAGTFPQAPLPTPALAQ
jgi:hypothetical protein